MDRSRFDALTRAVGERRSRRDALRLLAGALGGALAVRGTASPVEAAVTAGPPLGAGWTHLAGTTTGLLFYKQGTGSAVSGTFVNGRFARKATYGAFDTGWTHIIGANRSLLFYRADTGLTATAYLNDAGVLVQPDGTVRERPRNLPPFPGTAGGRFVRYAGDQVTPAALTAGGREAAGFPNPENIRTGWRQLAGAGVDTYLLYRGDTGKAITGRIGLLTQPARSYFWDGRAAYRFAAGFTHVVGTYSGGLLFYKRQTGAGMTGYLDEFGGWHRTGTVEFGAEWTHVVGAGSRGVLFYRQDTGTGMGGVLSDGGTWTKTATYACAANGDPCQAGNQCCSGRCGFIEPGRGFCAAPA